MTYAYRCNEKLLKDIRSNLKRFDIRTHEGKGLKQAAVALTVAEARPPDADSAFLASESCLRAHFSCLTTSLLLAPT